MSEGMGKSGENYPGKCSEAEISDTPFSRIPVNVTLSYFSLKLILIASVRKRYHT